MRAHLQHIRTFSSFASLVLSEYREKKSYYCAPSACLLLILWEWDPFVLLFHRFKSISASPRYDRTSLTLTPLNSSAKCECCFRHSGDSFKNRLVFFLNSLSLYPFLVSRTHMEFDFVCTECFSVCFSCASNPSVYLNWSKTDDAIADSFTATTKKPTFTSLSSSSTTDHNKLDQQDCISFFYQWFLCVLYFVFISVFYSYIIYFNSIFKFCLLHSNIIIFHSFFLFTRQNHRFILHSFCF